MQKAINRLHRQILAGVNQGGGALGALVIVGSVSAPDHGSPAATPRQSCPGLSRKCAVTPASSPLSAWPSP